MAVVVRRATREDAGTIAGLAFRLVQQHIEYDPVRFARLGDVDGMEWFYGEQTEAKNAAVFVAEFEDSVVGFAYLEYQPRNYVDLSISAARLHDVYVDEAARGTGAGKKLIEAAIEEAKRFRASKILLSVAVKNKYAQEFFRREGFQTTMFEMMLKLPG